MQPPRPQAQKGKGKGKKKGKRNSGGDDDGEPPTEEELAEILGALGEDVQVVYDLILLTSRGTS